jgi:hypothetical protein
MNKKQFPTELVSKRAMWLTLTSKEEMETCRCKLNYRFQKSQDAVGSSSASWRLIAFKKQENIKFYDSPSLYK